MSKNSALLIVDAQVNMFTEGSSVFGGDSLLQKLSLLIERARAARLPVIFVQHNGGPGDPDMPGTPGWEIHANLAPAAGEIAVQKHTPDAFHETTLQSELQAQHIDHLIIAGMQTDMCIDATCRRAHALGYAVTLVKDAHSTFDTRDLTAAQSIDQHNAALGKLISVVNTQDIAF